MNIAMITGASGLIGGEAVAFFSSKFDQIVGIDNDMRKYFFGPTASTQDNKNRLLDSYQNYSCEEIDIRDNESLSRLFKKYRNDIKLIIHAAAQPSHDWAAKEPITDFTINTNGTLNLLELSRTYCPETVFIFTSTNKVYGDTPNRLPFRELEKRYEIDSQHPYFDKGIDENLSIDQSQHSLFGASKLSADILAQEYGRYFQMKVGVFRGGCLTGPTHLGAELHGFLAYLVKCIKNNIEYRIFGYKGKQVRDNIHSYDLVNMFDHFYQNPKRGEVYNVGGSRHSNCSIVEMIEFNLDKKIRSRYLEDYRIGDHI